jgi:broad specificity phosphatase PhoE
MRLILIRHGLTDYNLKGRYYGFKDLGLNRIGRDQAREIKMKLKRYKIDRVYCSDLKRSWQTAKIIFTESCPIVKRKNLREINFGKWEGLNFKQILKKYPFVYKKWLKDPFSIDVPGGEKTKHFTIRIKREIKNIIKNNPNKTVAIVSHYGPMRIILNNSFGIKRKDFWKIELEPKAIYIIDYK